MHFVHAAQLERMHHAAGGVDLFKTEFGMRMQVTAKGRQFRMKLRNLRKDTPIGAQGGRRLHDGLGIHFRLKRRQGFFKNGGGAHVGSALSRARFKY